MPDHLGGDMRKVKDDKEEPEKEIKCKHHHFEPLRMVTKTFSKSLFNR